MQEGTIFYTTALRELPLVHQQANKSITRLDITQDNTKRLKKIIPQDANNLIVEKKMVHRLLISLAHTAPIDHNYVPLPKVVHGKDLPYNHRPSKKSHSQRNLGPPNTLPRKTKCPHYKQGCQGFLAHAQEVSGEVHLLGKGIFQGSWLSLG